MIRSDVEPDPAVDLGSWQVGELLAAGFDRLGAVQPLLRPEREENDLHRVRADLVHRGLLGQRDGRWRPLGDLGVLLTARAAALLTVVVTGAVGPPVLLLGRFGGGDGLLQLVEGSAGCAAGLRTAGHVARDLVGLVLDGQPESGDGPVLRPEDATWAASVRVLAAAERSLTLDAVLVEQPGVRRLRRLTLAGTSAGGWLVSGVRDGEDGDLSAQRCSRTRAVEVVLALLRGD